MRIFIFFFSLILSLIRLILKFCLDKEKKFDVAVDPQTVVFGHGHFSLCLEISIIEQSDIIINNENNDCLKL